MILLSVSASNTTVTSPNTMHTLHAIAVVVIEVEFVVQPDRKVGSHVMNQEDLIRDIQKRYRQPGRFLNEFQRRHWAAVEAMKLGRGGITIVSKALRISRNTIRRGIREIATGQADVYAPANAQIRKPGGGRKSNDAPVRKNGQSGDTREPPELLPPNDQVI